MYKRILVTADGSPTALAALAEAARLAPADGVVQLLHVVENPALAVPLEPGVMVDTGRLHESLLKGGEQLLAEAAKVLAAKGVAVQTRLIDLAADGLRSIPDAILAEAERWPADVIVIGTHGRRGVGRLIMGSVAESVLRGATRPVLLVRAPASGEA